MATHHFISYSAADGLEIARRMATALEDGDPPIPVWFDKFEKDRHGLRPGEYWDFQIDEALRTCESLIFLMTPDSVEAGSVCTQEWSRALKYKKPVIPIEVDRSAGMPFRLDPRESIQLEADFDRGIARLRSHLQWLSSPAGKMRSLEYRLADARRALRRAQDSDQPRVAAEIARLESELSEMREVVDHPEEAVRKIQRDVAEGFHREREHEARLRTGKHCRTVNVPPGVPPSYFQDRHVETCLIADLLRDPGKRLIFVIGRGGIGKTAMVCRLLQRVENGEPIEDGPTIEANAIVYLSASGTHRISVPALYLDLCGLLPGRRGAELRAFFASPKATTQAKFERLLASFKDRTVLVLFDNFEDVVDVERLEVRDTDLADALRTWLDTPPHPLKLVVTSRVAPRDILVEQPARQARIDLEDGLPSPFAENILRAMDVDGSLGLRTAPDRLLDQARERTRGYPRALEALFAILSADRDSTLQDILAYTEGTLPENVVRVLVGEAFSRLDARAQRVMEALAIFYRPVTRSAVDYLLLPYINGLSSAQTLGRLLNMRFIRKEDDRYFLHPVDRDYALSRVPRGTPADRTSSPPVYSTTALLNRAADYFREARTDPASWKDLNDLTIPLAEFDLRCQGEDFEAAFTVWSQVSASLETWSYYHLLREMGLRIDGRVGPPNDLWVASILGSATSRLGRYLESLSYWERALARLPELSQTIGEAWVFYSAAWCHSQLGNTPKAIEYSTRALSAAERDGDTTMAADTWSILGWYYAQCAESSKAVECCLKGVELNRELRHANSLATALTNLADVLLDLGRYAESIEYAAVSVRTDPHTVNLLSWNYALTSWAHLGLGNLDAAFTAAEQAQKCDEPENNPMVLNLLGIIALLKGLRQTANEAFHAGVAAADALLQFAKNSRAFDAKGISLSGLALCADGPVDAAVTAHTAARDISRDSGVISRVLWQYDHLARVDPEGKLTRARMAARGL